MNCVKEIIIDFNIDKNSYLFKYYLDIIKDRLKDDYEIDENFNWYEYFENHPEHFNLNRFFESILYYDKKLQQENIFNGNEDYYFTKYSNIEQSVPKNLYKSTFNLAEFIWDKSIKKNYITFEQKLKLIPYISNLKRAFIYRLLDEDYQLCYKILEFLDYKLDKKELNVLYCREEITILEKIELEVNDELLQKALIYGRKKVLELLDTKGLLEKHSNPFLLDKVDYFNSVDDIWYGWSWGNDECERNVIREDDIDHEGCFDICKKYFRLEQEHFEKWFKISDYSSNSYGPSMYEITDFFINEDDFKTKKSIIHLIEKYGKDNIWKILKKKSSNILDVILEN